MLSLEDISAIKIAVEICCNCYQVKMEILIDEDDEPTRQGMKNTWVEIMECEIRRLVKNLVLSIGLRKKVIGLVAVIILRMFTWVSYHHDMLDLSREFLINILNGSMFTSRGIINSHRAAKELMKREELNLKQKYKLACFYSFEDQILRLFRQMSTDDQALFYGHYPYIIRQPPIVMFWSFYVMGDVDKIRGETNVDLYLLTTAVRSGIKSSVENCLLRTEVSNIEYLIAIVLKMEFANSPFVGEVKVCDYFGRISLQDSWIHGGLSWVPTDFIRDLFWSLFYKLSEVQQFDFFKKDLIERNGDEFLKDSLTYKALWMLLDGPYPDFFIKAANLVWDILPERGFADLLSAIAVKIDHKHLNLKFGDDNIYNYRKLLKEFWCLSPQSFKIFIFSNLNHFSFLNGNLLFLRKLLLVKTFTTEDWINIEVIFESVPEEKKSNMILGPSGKEICLLLIKKGKWISLIALLSNSFTSLDQIRNFKRELSMTKEVKSLCERIRTNFNLL